ncbi:hypothetical protein BUE80_DR012977 [Diplocarpon rosae]|nr:hypothetical protein BUE80_DR012977 [Diplocarpon rosae]
MVSSTQDEIVPEFPHYASSIVNIKHKARTWNIASAKFDFDYIKINSQVRVHADYGAYNEMEKMWHVEFYVWSHYFPSEPFPFPFPSATLPLLISNDNPAPEPNGPRPTNSTPVANPFPPIYTPNPRTPEQSRPNAHASFPAEAHQALHHIPVQRSAISFAIRGIAALNRGSPVRGIAPTNLSLPLHGISNANVGRPYNNSQRSPLAYTKANIGRAYNNGSTRRRASSGRGQSLGRMPSLESRKVPTVGAADGGDVRGNSRGAGVGIAKRHGRTAVEAARRQMKISRRTGGKH